MIKLPAEPNPAPWLASRVGYCDGSLRVNRFVPHENSVLFPENKFFIEQACLVNRNGWILTNIQLSWSHARLITDIYIIFIYDVFCRLLSHGSNHEQCLHDNCLALSNIRRMTLRNYDLITQMKAGRGEIKIILSQFITKTAIPLDT